MKVGDEGLFLILPREVTSEEEDRMDCTLGTLTQGRGLVKGLREMSDVSDVGEEGDPGGDDRDKDKGILTGVEINSPSLILLPLGLTCCLDILDDKRFSLRTNLGSLSFCCYFFLEYLARLLSSADRQVI